MKNNRYFGGGKEEEVAVYMLCESEKLYHRTSGLPESTQQKGILETQQTSEIRSKSVPKKVLKSLTVTG